jgi:hypothetical protein
MDTYRICSCGEFREGALLRCRRGQPTSCLNCAAGPNYARGRCSVCLLLDRPVEDHHPAGWWALDITFPTCRNCHASIHRKKRELDHLLRATVEAGHFWPALLAGLFFSLFETFTYSRSNSPTIASDISANGNT